MVLNIGLYSVKVDVKTPPPPTSKQNIHPCFTTDQISIALDRRNLGLCSTEGKSNKMLYFTQIPNVIFSDLFFLDFKLIFKCVGRWYPQGLRPGMSVSKQACWFPIRYVALRSGMSVTDGSPIMHVSLRWGMSASNKSLIRHVGLGLAPDRSQIGYR